MNKLVRYAGAAAVCMLVQGGAVATTAMAATVQSAHGLNAPAHLFNNAVKSTNWSGYAVEGTAKFTDVLGTWVEPAVTCTKGSKYSSFWVGIDGYNSNSVEQLGTDSDCHGTTPSYYAWWEMYPAASVNLPASKYPVEAGDTLTGEVSVSGSSFTLSLKSSRGWTFKKVKTGSGLEQESAEWIAEAPEVGSSLAKLANFGTVGFTNCMAADGGADAPISSFTADSGPHEITMVKGATIKAAPTALNGAGTAFSITWHHA